MEHIGDSSYLFDQIMLAANGNYLIDLSEPITILKIQTEESIEEEETTRVIVTLEGYDEIVFRMRPSPSGRWRVLQVMIPGSDVELLPWSTLSEAHK